MLIEADMRRLVDMQQRSYLLLRWMAKAVTEGFVRFETAHGYSTLPRASEAWIAEHYWNIPDSARPPRDELAAFSAFFSTYLTNSFDFVSQPGKQRYSPAAHCFCPMCSWLVEAPNLKAKKPKAADKRRAQKMRWNALLNLAAAHQFDIRQTTAAELLDNRQSLEEASLLAYGCDLLQRANGIANGPAVLVLWRGFAWNELGSPKQGFRLHQRLIIGAQRRLVAKLKNIAETESSTAAAETNLETDR